MTCVWESTARARIQLLRLSQSLPLPGLRPYQLLDTTGAEVFREGKRAFCLIDSERAPSAADGGRPLPRYSCAIQGISAGWADSYGNGSSCQFVDITAVPPRRYHCA